MSDERYRRVAQGIPPFGVFFINLPLEASNPEPGTLFGQKTNKQKYCNENKSSADIEGGKAVKI